MKSDAVVSNRGKNPCRLDRPTWGKNAPVVRELHGGFVTVSATTLMVILVAVVNDVISISDVRTRHRAGSVLALLSRRGNRLSAGGTGRTTGGQLNSHFGHRRLFRCHCFDTGVDGSNGDVGVSGSRVLAISPSTVTSLTGAIRRHRQAHNVVHCRKADCTCGVIGGGGNRVNVIFLSRSVVFGGARSLVLSKVILNVVDLVLFRFILVVSSGQTVGPIVRTRGQRGRFVAGTNRRLGAPLSVVSTGARLRRVVGNRDR